MASQSEAAWAFYSAGSGLTPAASFSLHEHKLKYLQTHGATGTTMDDVMRSLYGTQGEYAYLAAATGQSGSLDALRAYYYANGGGGSTTATFDNSTYDSTAVFA